MKLKIFNCLTLSLLLANILPKSVEAAVFTDSAGKNVLAMGEATNHSLFILTEMFGDTTGIPSVVTSAGSYSETGWSWTVDDTFFGNPLNLSYTGSFDPSSDTVSWTASGGYAGLPLSATGSATFLSATSMQYSEEFQIGFPPWRWLLRAIEVVGTVIKPGAGLALSIVSNVILEVFPPTPPTNPPPPPVRPTVPRQPGQETALDFVRANPTFLEADKRSPTSILITSCEGEGNESSGLYFCTTTARASVPEPTSILGLLTLGILGAGSTLKRQQKQKSTEKELQKSAR